MKVFISSTAQDLVVYRKLADDTVLRLSQESVAMERFGPLPGEPIAECERKARESDVVLCLLAHRNGFVPDKGRGSITRREVEAARAAGKDVLVWIVADDYPWTEKKEQEPAHRSHGARGPGACGGGRGGRAVAPRLQVLAAREVRL
jgi:hypothetical protein